VNRTSPLEGIPAHVFHATVPLSAVYSSPFITNVISSIGFFVVVVAPEKFSNTPVIEKVHLSIASATSTSQSNTRISVLD
jgi:hypothetical protein